MKQLNYNEKIKELKKGAESGYCRICGNFRKLSVDHIPPKSCGNNNRIKIYYKDGIFISQNGLTCKTICEDCNNNLLGARYDKELIKLYNEIKIMNSSSIIFKRIKVDINVKDLVRCLLGHLIAICVYKKDKTVQELLNTELENNYIFNKYREFVLGKTDKLENCCCYYWYYPYSDIIINPYFLKADVLTYPKTTDLFGTIIKFYPIALYIVNTKNSTGELDLDSIDFNSNHLLLNVKEKIRNDFPEMPSKNELIMSSSGASFDVDNKPF